MDARSRISGLSSRKTRSAYSGPVEADRAEFMSFPRLWFPVLAFGQTGMTRSGIAGA